MSGLDNKKEYYSIVRKKKYLFLLNIYITYNYRKTL